MAAPRLPGSASPELLKLLLPGGRITDRAQMVRIHRGEAGAGPCLESGVDHRLDGEALGW